ncbi:hypothetical protein NEDG_00293 [Nematocida displodere]|uniref:Tubulin-specific chaperone A n=1 Tax=Nematocida displodere TaxID=1805483 RepID=A0A177EIW3_9MICR|nr:hypothetical protein NEDG_00293 [Nematocida displodere]
MERDQQRKESAILRVKKEMQMYEEEIKSIKAEREHVPQGEDAIYIHRNINDRLSETEAALESLARILTRTEEELSRL